MVDYIRSDVQTLAMRIWARTNPPPLQSVELPAVVDFFAMDDEIDVLEARHGVIEAFFFLRQHLRHRYPGCYVHARPRSKPSVWVSFAIQHREGQSRSELDPELSARLSLESDGLLH
ncbi:hypothetical protein [Gallaecimonas xiamenensis]|uniref:Uncharacterized protein n=1 Tax=Gallaecimonas xiamenensis 3-C-1 TaxID=745411 RepID=K2K4W7_9GAMM|nr:hypothetical protein [Gallaecimonas xiamenensis]EKE78004.1 hypothetical protein B3C1_01050 [Gallaecimonas xiamenensis 3-C-1]